MSDTDDHKIGPTAHYTAYVWHRLGMPYAAHFATPKGRALFWAFRLAGEGAMSMHPRLPSMTQYLELRHRGIEAAVEELEPDRLVELGAGLTRRTVTFAARGVDAIEVDLPHMVAAKKELLARAPSEVRAAVSSRLTHVAADVLADDFEAVLRDLLRGAERPVVVAEGLIGYFAPEDRVTLARTVAGALEGRGAFVAEMRDKSRSAQLSRAVGFLRAGIGIVTRGRGIREDFESPEAIEAFLRDAGFTAVERRAPVHDLAQLELPSRVFVAR